MSSMKDRMHTEEIYFPGDDEIMTWQTACLDRLYDFNQTRPTEGEKRQALLKAMFAEIGEGCYIEPPLHANFGGAHVHFGSFVYANFNLTLVDDTHIYVGDHTMFAPNVVRRIRFCPNCAKKAISITDRCISGKTAGSARGQFSCPASPSGIIP